MQINSSQQSVYSASFPSNTQPLQTSLSSSYSAGLLTPSALKRLSLNTPLTSSTTLFNSNGIPLNNSYSRSVSTPDFVIIDGTQSAPSGGKWAGLTNAPPPSSLPIPTFVNNNNHTGSNNGSPATDRKSQTHTSPTIQGTSLSPLILPNSYSNQKMEESPVLIQNLNLSTSLPKTTPWETLLAANSNAMNSSPSPTPTIPIPSKTPVPNAMYTQSNSYPTSLRTSSSSLPLPHTSMQPPPSPAFVLGQANGTHQPAIPTISLSNGYVTPPLQPQQSNGNQASLSQLSTDLCKLLNINGSSNNVSSSAAN
eukprot:TRINITY_DN1051_c0_g1_i3.p2 TRINITY_DN1051_c0_g1~~TRINITY_DN1051_c0_g1_i3.p2  ORF type:complete len:309 (+),score=76.84 TRINITY_DN1051_c0_g1_i3:1926-2852(+)